MTAVLAAIALLVLWFTIEGLRNGVLRRIIELAGLILVFVFAAGLAGQVEPVLSGQLDLSPRAAFVGSWVVVLVVGIVGVRLLANFLGRLMQLSIVGWLDRAGGAVLGMAFGLLVSSCVLVVLIALPIDDEFQDNLKEDPLTGELLHLAPTIYDLGRAAWKGDGFFEMMHERIEPAARRAAERLEAAVDEIRDPDGEPEQ
jgi:membrane protein required for colicin V production